MEPWLRYAGKRSGGRNGSVNMHRPVAPAIGRVLGTTAKETRRWTTDIAIKAAKAITAGSRNSSAARRGQYSSGDRYSGDQGGYGNTPSRERHDDYGSFSNTQYGAGDRYEQGGSSGGYNPQNDYTRQSQFGSSAMVAGPAADRRAAAMVVAARIAAATMAAHRSTAKPHTHRSAETIMAGAIWAAAWTGAWAANPTAAATMQAA
jgi:hypothetical protein